MIGPRVMLYRKWGNLLLHNIVLDAWYTHKNGVIHIIYLAKKIYGIRMDVPQIALLS